jgi:hypothetical protein
MSPAGGVSVGAVPGAGVRVVDAAGQGPDRPVIRGLHSSTFQLNQSRF